MGLRQQRMTAIGKEKLLAVVVEDVHVRDTALKIGHIVHGILGILAVAKNFVLMLASTVWRISYGAHRPFALGL